MTEFMSEAMHASLLRQLKTSTTPKFSIILDSATDPSLNHYLITYFQMLVDHKPTIVFYRLILLDRDESAEGIKNKLLAEIEKDGLSDTLHMHLVGLATDGEFK